MTIFEIALSVFCLGGFIWAVVFQLPRARREQDGLAIASSLLTALVMLLGWLLIGVRAYSHQSPTIGNFLHTLY